MGYNHPRCSILLVEIFRSLKSPIQHPTKSSCRQKAPGKLPGESGLPGPAEALHSWPVWKTSAPDTVTPPHCIQTRSCVWTLSPQWEWSLRQPNAEHKKDYHTISGLKISGKNPKLFLGSKRNSLQQLSQQRSMHCAKLSAAQLLPLPPLQDAPFTSLTLQNIFFTEN